jgi:hypothetical protein
MDSNLEFELRQYRQQMVDGISSTVQIQAQILDRTGWMSALLGGFDALDGLSAIAGDIAADVARLATVSERALPQVVGFLAESTGLLGGIVEMLAAPAETRAAELYRKGLEELGNGRSAGSLGRARQWYEWAADDLGEATRIHRKDPGAWYSLGVALHRLERFEEAADAFSQCAFTSAPVSPELCATSLLVAASLFRRSGRAEDSARVLRDYPELEQCAEVHLALGVHHNDTGRLRRGLRLWPFYAVDARSGRSDDVDIVEAVAADLCGEHGWLVQDLIELQTVMQAIVAAVTALGFPPAAPPRHVDLRPYGVGALQLAAMAWHRQLEAAGRLPTDVAAALSELRRIVDARRAALASAQDDVTAIRVDGEQRVRQAHHNGTAEVERVRRAGAERLQSLRAEADAAAKAARQACDRRIQDHVRGSKADEVRRLQVQYEARIRSLRDEHAKRIAQAQQVLDSVRETVANEVADMLRTVTRLEHDITAQYVDVWNGRRREAAQAELATLERELETYIQRVAQHRPWIGADIDGERLRCHAERKLRWDKHRRSAAWTPGSALELIAARHDPNRAAKQLDEHCGRLAAAAAIAVAEAKADAELALSRAEIQGTQLERAAAKLVAEREPFAAAAMAERDAAIVEIRAHLGDEETRSRAGNSTALAAAEAAAAAALRDAEAQLRPDAEAEQAVAAAPASSHASSRSRYQDT